MSLLPELDVPATIHNTKRFFEKDFRQLQFMAHINYVDIKSPIISGMPSSHGSNNSMEDKATSYSHAKDVLKHVIWACNGLDRDQRDVLEMRIFRQMHWQEIMEVKHLSSRSQCYEILKSAYLQFAWGFADTEDLRVFIK